MLDNENRERWSWVWDVLEALGEVGGELLFAVIRFAIEAVFSFFDGLGG
jgi:hypothetical protein